MAEHNEFGKEGETAAADFLTEKGYSILHRNWRCGKKELDIVAKYNNELIVVEVKSRKDIRFGNPEEAVNDRKIRHIIASTDAYLRKFAIDLPVRFDIITVVGQEAPFQYCRCLLFTYLVILYLFIYGYRNNSRLLPRQKRDNRRFSFWRRFFSI